MTAPGEFGADGWWDEGGGHSLLHAINPARLAYVRQRVGGLDGKRVLDVGCGGGILSESMARDGARVTAVDPSAEAIETARGHAEGEGLDIDYRVASLDGLREACPVAVDVVTCMEVLEHVDDPKDAIASMAAALRPGGSLVLSTINRTALASAVMIHGLERALRALPPGTHRHEYFRRPSEVGGWCEAAGLRVEDVAGANWSFFGKTFLLSRTFMPVNYFLHARRD